jgi:hypothetical protein
MIDLNVFSMLLLFLMNSLLQASSADVCALSSESWQRLCDIREAALEWDARARALLAKDYPRLQPLRATVDDAMTVPLLQASQSRLLMIFPLCQFKLKFL